MAVMDLYSTRLAAQNKGADVFTYDELPEKLRIQIVQIWRELFGETHMYGSTDAWGVIVQILRKEYGRFQLVAGFNPDPMGELSDSFVNCAPLEALDAVELSCRAAMSLASENGFRDRVYGNAAEIAADCVKEINARFRAASVGFEFANNILVRVDSQFLHSEAVLPALSLLNLVDVYAGAEAEFRAAHEDYRRGDASGTLVECCKAFESIMKAICAKRGWIVNDNDTASKLVAACFANGLIPPYWQTHFSGLRSILESALPTPRNKTGGHGSGTTPANVPMELARYVLHMTAATLLFLAEAEARLP